MGNRNRASRIHLRSAQYVALGFLGVILIGALLLYLPISSTDGCRVSFVDALFTAATSGCVTGLVTVSTAAQWSVFGKTIIFLLIQLGGLGVVTCMTVVLLLLGKRLSVGRQKLIRETYNLDSMSGLSDVIRRIVKGTFLVEGIGAVLYGFVFIPQFGVKKGIAYSVFHSVSAFCNAGIDLLGDNSLVEYAMHPVVNLTTMWLIIMGGLGYIVWWEAGEAIRMKWKHAVPLPVLIRRLSLHTKIVLCSTGILIVGGAAAIFITEYILDGGMKDCSMQESCILSLFQSVTCRTAGFFTFPQDQLSQSGALISMLLMFVGGSPMGTAGGMKTTTLFVLIFTSITFLKGKTDTEVFARKIPSDNIRAALVVVMIGMAAFFISTLVLTSVTDAPFLDILYETASAVGTVGLSRGLTSQLPVLGKLVIILTMYIGRIGPVTLATALTIQARTDSGKVHLPVKKVLIG